MALIKCPDCNEEISDTLNYCIHCGCPVSETKKPKEERENKTTATREEKVTLNSPSISTKKDKKIDFIMLALVIIGAILIIYGLSIYVPGRTFSFYTIEEYVGGDAYNAMIEASIRGGEISSAIVSKAIYICSGLIIAALGITRKKAK